MVSDRSNGIYRSVVATVIGLILIGASEPPKQASKPEQATATKPEPRRPPTVADTTSKPFKTINAAKKTGPCGPRRYKGDDDLCAQWKAADSAADAAKWGWWQLIISGVGLLALAYTLFLTRKSTQAAIDTVNTQIAAERPVLQLDSLIFSNPINVDNNRISMGAQWLVTNFGKSPAYAEEGWIQFTTKIPNSSPLKKPMVAFVAVGKGFGAVDFSEKFYFEDDQYVDFIARPKIYTSGLIIYRDAHGVRWETGFIVETIFNHPSGSIQFYPVNRPEFWIDRRLKQDA